MSEPDDTPRAELEPRPRTPHDRRGVYNRSDGKIDLAEALKLRLRGLTYEDIGRKYGVSGSAVHHALKKFRQAIEEPESIRAFRENEAELLDDVASRIVAHMADPAVIGKASLNNAAFALSKLHEARRLIRGESTANVGIRTTLVLEAHGKRQIASDSEDIDPSDEGSTLGG